MRSVDYRGTDGCRLARWCAAMVCCGDQCRDYEETKQHRKWREKRLPPGPPVWLRFRAPVILGYPSSSEED